MVVDIDGTLVDSNYLHVVAWTRAFADAGIPLESWRLHRVMGMGGDRLVAELAGDDVESEKGDHLRELWQQHYDQLIDEVKPFGDAAGLLEALAERGLKVVIATSGRPEHTARALKALGIEGTYPYVDSSEASTTKPAPDLVERAIAEVKGDKAVMIGDTVWDAEAAAACDVPTIALLTGGIERATLADAGAVVYESPHDLLRNLDEALSRVAAGQTESG